MTFVWSLKQILNREVKHEVSEYALLFFSTIKDYICVLLLFLRINIY